MLRSVLFIIASFLVLSRSNAAIGSINRPGHIPYSITVGFDREIHPQVKSINIISGLPLTSLLDTQGGFGDVAANFVSALNLKKRHPQIEVTLLVTTSQNESRPGVLKSSEIIKIMEPDLDPTQMDTIQKVRGLQVIFLSEDAETMIRTVSDTQLEKIPKADITLQFAANKTGIHELARKTSRVAFDFEEFGSASTMRFSNSKSHPLPVVTMQAGPNKAGYFYVSPPSGIESSLAGSATAGKTVAFCYSKDSKSVEAYASAVLKLARKNSYGRYLLVLPSSLTIDPSYKPANLEISQYSRMTHNEVQSLIFRSDLPPLITGDVSLSIAMSSVGKGRLFLYDYPAWKTDFMDEFISDLKTKMLALNSEVELKLLENMLKLSGTGIHQNSADEILKFFESKTLQNNASRIIHQEQRKNDIYKNVFLIHQIYQIFELEIKSGLSGLLNFLTSKLISAGNWNRLKNELALEFQGLTQDKGYAVVTLAKLGYYKTNINLLIQHIDQLFSSHDHSLRAIMISAAVESGPLATALKSSSASEAYQDFLTHKVQQNKKTAVQCDVAVSR